MSDSDTRIVPFLKWAGGKRWFVSRYASLFPQAYRHYIEPFLGSGAAFFYLRPCDATLSDINADLILCYEAIRDDWRAVKDHLVHHQREHSLEHYYRVRESVYNDIANKAAQFLYLNRTCWNGLYRVNLHGKFNVPKGTKDNVLLNTDNFHLISKLLDNISLLVCDFEGTIDTAKDGDFIYADPPYTVRHNVNGFLKYNEKLFSWDDQVRLRDAILRAVGRGAKALVTNANHSSIRDLYEGFPVRTPVSRPSVLAGDPTFRSSVEELVIQTWRP